MVKRVPGKGVRGELPTQLDTPDVDDGDTLLGRKIRPLSELGGLEDDEEADDTLRSSLDTTRVDDHDTFDQTLLGLAVIDEPTIRLSSGSSGKHRAPTADLIAGRYHIEGRIGEGGMGEVFLVRHRHLARNFALKVMQRELGRDAFYREMFHREAQLASLLQHPHIVSVVDFGEDPKHGLFMVMELLEGEPLSQRLRDHGALPVKVVCDVISQLADALVFSHSRRVVHADIKPDNVLCLSRSSMQQSRAWEVKLLDFGMANLWSAERDGLAALGGTPPFMAPERIDGQSPHPSMDIYSLGVLTYLMITGRVPFTGATAEEVFEAHRTQAPVPMSEVIGERLPPRLELLVDRALAKRPQDRHRDATAFAGELRDLMKLQGLKDRRKEAYKSSRLVGGLGVARRDRAASAAFDHLPFPAGSILEDGTICLANRALAYFLTGTSTEPAEGINILQTRLPLHFHELEKAIAAAIHQRETSKALIQLDRSSSVSRLHVIIRASRDTPNACSLIIVPIESGARAPA